MSTGADSTPLRPPSATGLEATAAMAANAATLEREMAWFDTVLQARLTHHFQHPDTTVALVWPAAPDLAGDASEYAAVVIRNGLGSAERLVLVLALLPHMRPQALDTLFVRNATLDRGFSEFGGWKGKTHGGFLPTAETAAFVLVGTELRDRFALMALFDESHAFHRQGMLRIEHRDEGEPWFSGALVLSPEYLMRLTGGGEHKPDFSPSFPARRITTPLRWSDLVLGPEVLEEIDALMTWIRHADRLLDDWGLRRALKPGYRSLFHGPPGTGKTLTATLIGQEVQADVYRVDLSMVVSKYIGETEKNLAQVFDQAQDRHWILFFDEADALFGRRTATSSANDRYANQEVSYLLQRVEDFPGIVILASNLKGNIDEAFSRRFQSMVHFPMPDAGQRLRLWQGLLEGRPPLAEGVDLQRLADDHEFSGGAIANIVRFAAIRALQAGRDRIVTADLARAMGKELRKEGRTP